MARPEIPGCQTAIMFEQRTEQTLSEAAKIFRDAFVVSYIVDFRGSDALFRLGFQGEKKQAQVRASALLREQYVAEKLAKTIRELKPSDVVSRGQVMARLWEEANNAFDAGVRVTALAHLAKMLGMMDKVTEVQNAVTLGVMLIPMSDPNDWTTAAQASQLLLKQRAGEE